MRPGIGTMIRVTPFVTHSSDMVGRTMQTHIQSELFGATRSLPDGLVYVDEFITPAEEKELLTAIEALPLQEARYKGYTAKRRIASFGSQYAFDRNERLPAPPLPPFLVSLRGKAADWLAIPAQAFAHALVTEYHAGTPLGWHRDVPDFEQIVGISLAAEARMRFRPYPYDNSKKREMFALDLAPRSAYVLQRAARWGWQHSIPPTKSLRYSITFRTLSGRAVQHK